MSHLLPHEASSAIIVALAFDAPQAARIRIPRGFGFLAPAPASHGGEEHELLACTFVNQKFSHCAPLGAVLLRTFFGGRSAEVLCNETDEVLTQLARRQLSRIVGPLPEAAESVVRRWPLSLPQYTVGHIDRMAELETVASCWHGLHLVGNAYHGVGLSDLIREGRAAALNAGDRK
jgi:protoporphyrinogen/coproporphyrinogen III oxidase